MTAGAVPDRDPHWAPNGNKVPLSLPSGCAYCAGRLKGKPKMPVDKQPYRDAMAKLGAAVNVITTAGPGGRAGFTASAVTSVTDTPPTLIVCANRANDSDRVEPSGGAVHP